MPSFLALLRRDLRLALRSPGDALLGPLFFLTSLVLFPLGVGPAPETLARVASGTLWALALLSVLLTLERLYHDDAADGGLDLLVAAPAPLALLVLAKTLAHWLTAGLPLVLLAPLLAVMLNLAPGALPTLVLALLLGTPTLTLVGGIGAALLIGSRKGGALLALIVLPLYVPVLIFGVSAVEAAAQGFGPRPQLLLLGSFLLASLALAPLATAAALRLSLE